MGKPYESARMMSRMIRLEIYLYKQTSCVILDTSLIQAFYSSFNYKNNYYHSSNINLKNSAKQEIFMRKFVKRKDIGSWYNKLVVATLNFQRKLSMKYKCGKLKGKKEATR